MWKDYCDPGDVFWSQPPAPKYWYLDYRVQQMFSQPYLLPVRHTPRRCVFVCAVEQARLVDRLDMDGFAIWGAGAELGHSL